MLLAFGLATACIGPVSQAQTITVTANTVADELEQEVVLVNTNDPDNVKVTSTIFGALSEGNNRRNIVIFILFEEEVTLTVTNNNPDVVRFLYGGGLSAVTSVTTTIRSGPAGYATQFDLHLSPI